MQEKLLTLVLALVFLVATSLPTLADDNQTDGAVAEEEVVENDFALALVSGPENSEIAIDGDLVTFATPGDYVFRISSEEPDLVAMMDDEVALTVQASANGEPIKALFALEFAGGPPESMIEVNGQRVKFSLTGDYTLRLTPGDTAGVTMADEIVEVAVRSLEQQEAEFAAMAAALPDSIVEIEEVELNSTFLPAISSAHNSHAQQSAEEASAAAMAAIDALLADEFGGFDKNRIPVELQAWWTPAFGHIHVAVMAPLGQPVKGTINLPVRIVLHENPSVLQQFRIDSDQGVLMKVPLGNLRCKEVICAWALNVRLDTTKMTSGWRELRFRAETTAPDGRKYLPSSGVPVLVQNGGSVKNYNRFCNNTSLIGRGWYDGFGYVNAVVECVPTAPVKGVLTLRVKAQHASASFFAAIDRAHVIPAVPGWPYQPALGGTTLLDVKGNQSSWATITIDTRKLSNGWHNFFVRSDGPNGMVSKCSGCANVTSHPAGIAKFWFYVNN